VLEHLLALLVVGAPVGIRVVETDDPTTADRVADAVVRAAGAHGRAARLPKGEQCRQDEDCLTLHVFVGVTKHRVVIEWSSPDSPTPKTTRISLPSDGQGWDETLARVIDRLFPKQVEGRSETAPIPQPEEQSYSVDTFWGPAMIIAGGVAVIVASILAERSAHAQKQLFDGALDPAEYGSIRSRWRDFAIASVTLFVLGGVLAGAGIGFSFGL